MDNVLIPKGVYGPYTKPRRRMTRLRLEAFMSGQPKQQHLDGNAPFNGAQGTESFVPPIAYNSNRLDILLLFLGLGRGLIKGLLDPDEGLDFTLRSLLSEHLGDTIRGVVLNLY
jgi:hypothetical protein